MVERNEASPKLGIPNPSRSGIRFLEAEPAASNNENQGKCLGTKLGALHLGVSTYAARMLCRRFKLHGRLCLVEKPTKQQYSFEIKKEVVQRHLSGETAMDLAREFGLSSEHLVGGWSRKWRKGGDEALKPKPKGRPKGSGTPKPLSEEAKLRRQIARLEAENAYLKKLRDLRNQGHA